MVCVRQLEDVLVLQTLLLVPPPKGSVGGSATQCSIKTLLEGGRGELQRKITKHLNETCLDNVHIEVLNMFLNISFFNILVLPLTLVFSLPLSLQVV